MQKKTVYYYDRIPIENLLLNPGNARYVYVDDLPDEISSIKELLNMLEPQLIALAKDIAADGLNPNELPIVCPSVDNNDKYIVMDGNRRVACIKLMTTYKNDIESFGFSKKVVTIFNKLSSDIENVYCVVYEDESLVDPLLEKIHTSMPGIGQVRWDPLAQDKHKAKLGSITNRHALIELLKFSKYTPEKTLEDLKKTGWFSKLDRFAKNTYMRKFGISFIENDNIQLFLEESEVIKGICQLITDLQENKAAEIAQTEKLRDSYLYNVFPVDKLPDASKVNKNIIIFNTSKKVMEIYENSSTNKDDTLIDIIKTERVNKGEVKYETEANVFQNVSLTKDSEITSYDETDLNVDGEAKATSQDNYKKTKQYSLISESSYINIKDARTRELFDELKKVSVYYYKNTVSIAFRSLIEFSVDCFLISRNGKSASIPDNPHVTLVDKIEKVYSNLEGIYTSDKLKFLMPAIQLDIQNYRSKKSIDIIKTLNLCVHHTNYHPDPEQLKTIYKNVEPFLRLIWENIN